MAAVASHSQGIGHAKATRDGVAFLNVGQKGDLT
jgi:hypothetical protein